MMRVVFLLLALPCVFSLGIASVRTITENSGFAYDRSFTPIGDQILVVQLPNGYARVIAVGPDVGSIGAYIVQDGNNGLVDYTRTDGQSILTTATLQPGTIVAPDTTGAEPWCTQVVLNRPGDNSVYCVTNVGLLLGAVYEAQQGCGAFLCSRTDPFQPNAGPAGLASIPTVSINNVAVLEGDTAVLQIEVSPTSPNQVIVVEYSVRALTATAGSDYSVPPVPHTVTINPGESSINLAIPTIDDALVEATERFEVRLTGATGGALINDIFNIGVVTIQDDDTLIQLSVSPNNQNVNEGGDITWIVQLDRATGVTFTANFVLEPIGANPATVNGPNADIVPPNTFTITFVAGGATSQNIVIQTVNDALVEVTEALQIRFTSVSTLAVNINVGTAQANIISDNVASLILSPATVTVTEGSSATLTVGYAGGVTVPVPVIATISYNDVTAQAGVDYSAVVTSVTIPANTPSATFAAATLPDTLVELTESYQVVATASNTPALVSLAALNQRTSTISITDDDAPAQRLLSTSADVNVNENSNAIVTFSLSAARTVDTTVQYTVVPGTATVADYTATTPSTATIAANQLTTSITIPIVNDGITEPAETFSVVISGASVVGDITGLGDDTTVITIVAQTSTLAFVAPAVTAAEGTNAVCDFTITNPTASIITLNVATSLTGGVTAQDIVVPAVTTTGSNTGSITIPIQNDGIAEPEETFTVTISSASALIAGGSTAVCTVTIPAQTVVLSVVSSAAAAENVGTAPIAFSLSGPASVPTVFTWSTTDGTAAAPGDFTAITTQSVTIPALATTVSPTIAITNDAVREPEEQFTYGINTIVSGQATQGTSSGTFTITDDDGALVTIPAALQINEGDTSTFIVSMSETLGVNVVATFNVVAGTATQADFTTPTVGTGTFTVQIDAGSTSGTSAVSIATVQDALNEGTETFTIVLTGITGSTEAVVGTADTTIVTIIDDDFIQISRANAEFNIDEGASGTQVLNADASLPAGAPATVTYSCTPAASNGGVFGASGAANIDLSSAIGTTTQVTFPAETNQLVWTFDAVQDLIAEGSEFVDCVITAVGPTDRYQFTGVNAFQIGIVDDDVGTISFSPAVTGEEGTDVNCVLTVTPPVGGSVAANAAVTYSGANGANDGIFGTDAIFADTLVTTATRTVTIAVPDSTANAPIRLLADGLTAELDTETVVITADSVTGPFVVDAGANTCTVTITNNALGVVTMTAGATVVDITEGAPSRTLQFNVASAVATGVDVVITFATSGTAVRGTDYTLSVGGDTAANTITIPAGSTSADYVIAAIDDGVVEPTAESIIITITNVSPSGSFRADPFRSSETYTLNNDEAQAVALSWSNSGVLTVNQNSAISITLTASGGLSTDGTLPFDVTYTLEVQPGATLANGAPALSTSLPLTLTIPAGQTSATTGNINVLNTGEVATQSLQWGIVRSEPANANFWLQPNPNLFTLTVNGA